MKFQSGHRPIHAVFLALFILAGATAAEEQVGDDLVDESPAEPQAMWQFGIAEENFDQWVYRGNAAATRRRFEALLSSKIESAGQAGKLSERQRDKLELAGRGDIRRFDERVAALRARFKLIRQDINAVQAFFQEVQPLQVAASGDLFGDGSLYSKTLRRILTADQASEYARLQRVRRQFHYQARIESIVGMLDNGLALRDEQRRTIVELLLRHTSPPRQFGQYDQYVVILQLQRIPDGKLERVLDPDQRRMLQRVIDQVQGMEQFLQKSGVLPDPAENPPDTDGSPPTAENARKE